MALVYAVVEARRPAGASAQTLGLLALAAVLTAVFVAHRVALRRSAGAAGRVPVAGAGGRQPRALRARDDGFGVPFILTQYAQEVLGWSPIQFGLASVVMPVTAVIGTFTAQAIATKGGSGGSRSSPWR